MPEFGHPYSRGLRQGKDNRIAQNDERARTSRELEMRPVWRPTAIKTVDYTAKVWELVLVDPSSNNLTIKLPRARNFNQAEIYVKHVGASGTVTVVPTAGETIDTNTTYPWAIPDAGYHFIAVPKYQRWVVL